jgi:hypothetical protein
MGKAEAYLRVSELNGCSTSNGVTVLCADALAKQDADPSLVDNQWGVEEGKRVERLQRAARELGFEMPSQCLGRY